MHRARRGEGPTLIEVKTDRYLGHFQGDPKPIARADEAKTLRTNDLIQILGDALRAGNLLTQRPRPSCALQSPRASRPPMNSAAIAPTRHPVTLQHVFVQ
ncbi:thiamine pyrophosphate-dependent enzyme [Cupriavidus basilensis]